MWLRRIVLLAVMLCSSMGNAMAEAGSGPGDAVLAHQRTNPGSSEPANAPHTAVEWNPQRTVTEPNGSPRRLLATLLERAAAASSASSSRGNSNGNGPPPHPTHPSTPANPSPGPDAASPAASASSPSSSSSPSAASRANPPHPTHPSTPAKPTSGGRDASSPTVADSCTFYAPTIDSVRAGDGSLVVTILPPSNLSPSCAPVVGYSLRALTDSFMKVVGSTAMDANGGCTITMTGLVNGQVYNLSARATDGQTNSQISAVVQATPATVPGAPTITSSKAGDQSIVLSFDSPASNGGAAITGFEVTDALGSTASTSGPSSPLLLTGLVNGQNYQLVVTALNARGTGPPSALSPVLMPQPVPRRPFVFAVQSGLSHKLLIYFFDVVSGFVGTADYFRATARSVDMMVTAQSLPGAQQQSPLELVGLTDGEWYNVSVSGINEAGEGLPSLPLSVQVGVAAQSYSYFYADRVYTGNLCLPGAAAHTQQVPPISWAAMAQVNLGSLVDCSSLVAVITPPPESSTGSADGSSAGPDSAASVAPPPANTGNDGGSSTMENDNTSSSTGDSVTTPGDAASSTASSIDAQPPSDDSTGVIASVPADSRPRSGAVRLEIRMLFNSTSVLTVHAKWWRDIVAQWAQMLKIDQARLVVVAVQPVMVNRAKQQPIPTTTPRGRSATSRGLQQQQQLVAEPAIPRSLVSKADVTLVVDVLPPLRVDDTVSSAGFAGNLTEALQDPDSSVAMTLASSGASVMQISSVEGLLPPPQPADGSSSGLDTHSRLFVVGLSVGLACVAAMAIALGVMLWRGKQHRAAAVPKSPPPVIADGGGAKANAATAAASATAAANGSKRPQSPYSVPVRGYDDRRGPQVRVTSLRLEPAAAASTLPLHAQAHADRAKSSSPFNLALHPHYPQPLLVPGVDMRGLPRRPASHREGYLEPYVLQDHADDDEDGNGEKEELYTLQREDEPHRTPQPHTRQSSLAAAAGTGANGPLVDQVHYVFHRAAAASAADSAVPSSFAAESEPSVLMHDSVSAPSLQLQQLQIQLQPAPRLAPAAAPASASSPAPLLHNFYEVAESELDPLFLAAFKPAEQQQQQQSPMQDEHQPSGSASGSADSSVSRCTPFVDQSPPIDVAAAAAAAHSSTDDSHSGAPDSRSSSASSGSSVDPSPATLVPPPQAPLAPQPSHGAIPQPVSPLPPAALAAALPPSTPPAQPALGRSIMLLQPFSFAAAAAAAQPRAP